MATIEIKDVKGAAAGTVELSDAVFAIEPNVPVMHRTVKAQQASWRQGTANTRTRGMVRGGGKKPWRQKGTGRARQGSIRAPQWYHGGIVFAPKPRDYSYALPKKVRRLGMKSALSSKVAASELIVLDELTMEEYKTKTVVGVLSALNSGKKVLLVLAGRDEKVVKSAANIPGVKTAAVNTLNVYDILNCDTMIVVKDAVRLMEEVYA